MDPSYNNSFNGNNSGANPGPTPVPVSAPTPPVNPVSNSAPTPPPVSPIPAQNPSFAPAEPYANSDPSYELWRRRHYLEFFKSQKPWVIILIVFIVMALFAGIAFLIINRNNGGSGSATPSTLKEAFNSYANYVLYGKDSFEDIPNLADSDTAITPYFRSLSGDEKTKYINTATERYNTFTNLYYDEEGNTDELFDTYPLKTYFQDYPKVTFINEEEVLKLYNHYGKSEASQIIKQNYSGVSNISNNMAAFINTAQTLSLSYLEIISNIDNAGCLDDGTIIDNCYIPSKSDNIIAQPASELVSLSNSFYSQALGALLNIRGELYD